MKPLNPQTPRFATMALYKVLGHWGVLFLLHALEVFTEPDTKLTFGFTNVQYFAWALQDIENPCCGTIVEVFNPIFMLSFRVSEDP